MRSRLLAVAAVPLFVSCSERLGVTSPEQPLPPPAIERESNGEVNGMSASLYTLRNRNGLVAKITDYGATLVELWVSDREGAMADIVLGFDSVEDYVERNDPSFGSTVGRYANRIALGHFTLDDEEYELETNNGRHHLHGGLVGFSRVLWSAEAEETETGPTLRLTYISADGEEGYPGKLRVTVGYTLTHDDELRIEMSATTDAATIVNLAHHSYWNLAGHESGDIRDHLLELRASRYTPTDAELIPTGAIDPVEGTPFDFRATRRMGAALDQLAASRSRQPSGFDENFVIDGAGDDLVVVARLEDPGSGRVMELETNQPGVQLYTGNFLDGVEGKDGASYEKHQGLCLETQLFPDSANKAGLEGWPSPVLRPGETYRHVMVHSFSSGGPLSGGGR